MTAIRPDELDRELTDGSAPFVLDIRPREHYRRGSIDSSHNVPCYNDLRRGEESSLLDRLDEIPREERIVVVCKQGIVAKRATRLLTDAGYDAVTLAGGMGGWNGYRKGTVGYRLRSLLWRLLP